MLHLAYSAQMDTDVLLSQKQVFIYIPALLSYVIRHQLYIPQDHYTGQTMLWIEQ